MSYNRPDIGIVIALVVAMGVFVVMLFGRFARRDTDDWQVEYEKKTWRITHMVLAALFALSALAMMILIIVGWDNFEYNQKLSYFSGVMVNCALSCYALRFRRSPRSVWVRIRKVFAYVVVVLMYFGWPATVQQFLTGSIPGVYGDAWGQIILVNYLMYCIGVSTAWLLLRHYKKEKFVAYKVCRDDKYDAVLTEECSRSEIVEDDQTLEERVVDNYYGSKIEKPIKHESKPLSETEIKKRLLACYLIYIIALLVVAFVGSVSIINEVNDLRKQAISIWAYMAMAVVMMAMPYGLYYLQGRRFVFLTCLAYLVYVFLLSFFAFGLGVLKKNYGIVFLSAVLLSVVPMLVIWIAKLFGVQVSIKPVCPGKKKKSTQMKHCVESIKKVFKKVWIWVVGVLVLGGLVFGGIKWYKYYHDVYIPKKKLNAAVEEIKSQFDNAVGDEKTDIAIKILRKDTEWGYEGVSDYDIHRKLSQEDVE
ncbi:MAG: hypothetical protein K5867_00085 [Bacteroidales bacterium]|nr:hypothetical protein [Bacteroidales bacterium]